MKANGAMVLRIGTLRLAAAAILISIAIPMWGAPPNCAAAKKLFAANCAMCHMANGTGNAALKSPNFTDPKWQAAHKNPELFAAISDGVKGTSMPAWKSQLKPAEIHALIQCVIRGFGKKTTASRNPSSQKHPPA